MSERLEMLIEAERRGILPPDQVQALGEARRRGLVSSEEAIPQTLPAVEHPAIEQAAQAASGVEQLVKTGAGAVKDWAHDERIEAYVGAALAVTLPRVYAMGPERRARCVDYRHVVGWLVRKPQAFRHSQLRDDLLPSAT